MSLVQGVFHPTKIDSIHVENYEVEHYIHIDQTLTLILFVEFHDKNPVNITGFSKDGMLVYSSIPLSYWQSTLAPRPLGEQPGVPHAITSQD